MAKVKRGDRVLIHYTGRLCDGTVFDTSESAAGTLHPGCGGRGVAFAPLALVVGEGELLPALEDALVGLEPGARAVFTLPPARAFGPRHAERVLIVAREGHAAADGPEPRVGDVVEVTTEDGTLAPARIVALTEESVTLDWNHPLAGRELTFEVRVVGFA